jgi:hypothetical protein
VTASTTAGGTGPVQGRLWNARPATGRRPRRRRSCRCGKLRPTNQRPAPSPGSEPLEAVQDPLEQGEVRTASVAGRWMDHH